MTLRRRLTRAVAVVGRPVGRGRNTAMRSAPGGRHTRPVPPRAMRLARGLLAAVAVLSLPTSLAQAAPATPAARVAQGDLFSCANGTIYAIARPVRPTFRVAQLTPTLYSVDTRRIGSSPSQVNDTPVPEWSSFTGPLPNGLGITRGGVRAYLVEESTANPSTPVYSFDPVTGSHPTFSGTARANEQYIAGAVDPRTDIYYYADYTEDTNEAVIYGFNTATNQPIPGIIGTVPLPIRPAAGQLNNGDIAFDANGNLYILQQTFGTTDEAPSAPPASWAGVTVVPGPLPPSGSTTPPQLDHRELNTFAAQGMYNGLAFDNSGNMFLNYIEVISGASFLEQRDPSTGNLLAGPTAQTGLEPGLQVVDLAACATPPSLELRKNIISRDAAGDEFTLTVTGGGITQGNTATTSGGSIGDQPDAVAGPLLAREGTTYTFTETGANGADLSRYITTYRCVDVSDPDGPPLAAGRGTRFTLTVPPPDPDGPTISCTFSNQALAY